MDIHIDYSPSEREKTEYEKLLNKLFPTVPLYIFLAVATILLVFMAAQHAFNPSSRSLIYMSISLLSILLGGAILYSTKKSLPGAKKSLMDTIGKEIHFIFTDDEIDVRIGNEKNVTYPRAKLIGQYCTDRHYIFCLSNRPAMMPLVIGITKENIDALNMVVQKNSRNGIRLRKLKLSRG